MERAGLSIHLSLLIALEGQPLLGPTAQEALGPTCPQISKPFYGLLASALSFIVFAAVVLFCY